MLLPYLLTSALIVTTTCSESDQQVHSIPLEKVWGYRISGTKNVEQLEPNKASFETILPRERIKNSLVSNTRWRLNSNFKPAGRDDVGTAFVVPSIGFKALKEANAIIAGEKKRTEQLPAAQPLTLVFYAYSNGRAVRLDEVTKSRDEIVVKYHFHIHGQLRSSPYFALIPAGNFSPGNVSVKIKRLPDVETKNIWGSGQTPPYDGNESRRIVCEPFVFKVIDNKTEKNRK